MSFWPVPSSEFCGPKNIIIFKDFDRSSRTEFTSAADINCKTHPWSHFRHLYLPFPLPGKFSPQRALFLLIIQATAQNVTSSEKPSLTSQSNTIPHQPPKSGHFLSLYFSLFFSYEFFLFFICLLVYVYLPPLRMQAPHISFYSRLFSF